MKQSTPNSSTLDLSPFGQRVKSLATRNYEIFFSQNFFLRNIFNTNIFQFTVLLYILYMVVRGCYRSCRIVLVMGCQLYVSYK